MYTGAMPPSAARRLNSCASSSAMRGTSQRWGIAHEHLNTLRADALGPGRTASQTWPRRRPRGAPTRIFIYSLPALATLEPCWNWVTKLRPNNFGPASTTRVRSLCGAMRLR